MAPFTQAMSEQAPLIPKPASATELRVHWGAELAAGVARLQPFVERVAGGHPSRDLRWLLVLAHALRQEPHCLEAMRREGTCGVLPLIHVQSRWFGRFLVSLPYLNQGGVIAEDDEAAADLVKAAVELAESLDVRFLELRHERAVPQPLLSGGSTEKVHMRLALSGTTEELWEGLAAKVRNQVRKGRQNDLSVHWGQGELLPEFYRVYSHNMRDLGTPVYSRRLFECILEEFVGQAELCVVRSGPRPLAGALVLHGQGVSEVPSASSLRRYNWTNANMLMYWSMLERALQRGQRTFDFGRSTPGSSVYRFKEQWGAAPWPTAWQYHVRRGSSSAMRPQNPRYRPLIGIWRQLPVCVTRWIGPAIARGIP